MFYKSRHLKIIRLPEINKNHKVKEELNCLSLKYHGTVLSPPSSATTQKAPRGNPCQGRGRGASVTGQTEWPPCVIEIQSWHKFMTRGRDDVACHLDAGGMGCGVLGWVVVLQARVVCVASGLQHWSRPRLSPNPHVCLSGPAHHAPTPPALFLHQ